MSQEYDFTFRSMGSDIRFLIGAPLVPGTPAPEAVAHAGAPVRARLRGTSVPLRPGQRAVAAQP